MPFNFDKYERIAKEEDNDWLQHLSTVDDYRKAIEDNFYIKSEGGGRIPFRLRKPQIRLLQTYVDAVDSGEGVKIVHLKARQYGGSTLIQAILLLDAIRHPDASLLTVAHDSDSSMHIMDDMAAYMVETLNAGIKISIKKRRYKPNMELILSNGSKLAAATAKNLNLGRSKTFRFLHLSEVAFWWRTLHTFEAADDIFQSVLSTVPEASEVPDATIILESTGYGRQGAFYEYYLDAEKGGSSWIPFFVPWYEIEKYHLDVPDTDRRQFDLFEEYKLDIENGKIVSALGLDRYEVDLVTRSKFELDWGHILWRRKKLNDFRGDIDRFNQEYPATVNDAFNATGSPAYSPASMVYFEQQARSTSYVSYGVLGYPTPEPDVAGFLRVWTPPIPGGRYIIGADVAAGDSAHKFNSNKASYSAAQVLLVRPDNIVEQVAEYMARPDPIEFGEILATIGRWYNSALLVPERNADGLSTINEIMHHDYPNLYTRNIDAGDALKILYGIQTTATNKKLMLNQMRYAVSHKLVVIRSLRLIQQMHTVHYTLDGRIMMPRDADLVMSFMIGYNIAAEEIKQQKLFNEIQQEKTDGVLIWDSQLGLISR